GAGVEGPGGDRRQRVVEHVPGVVRVHRVGDRVVPRQVRDRAGGVAGDGEQRAGLDGGVAQEAVGGGVGGVGQHGVPAGERGHLRQVVGRDGGFVAGPELLEGRIDVDDEAVDGAGDHGG